MQIASSACRTCSASWSAVEKTATVPRPSSRQARKTRSAISPRLATRTLSTPRLAGLEGDDGLARVHEVFVLDQEARHASVRVAVDLVEALHDLDQPDHVAHFDFAALAHVRVGLRVRPPVERARQGRLDRPFAHTASRLAALSLSSTARSASIASSIDTSRNRTVSPTGRNCPIFQ